MIYLKWIDSSSVDGWIQKEDYSPGLEVIETLGFIISEDDKTISVCSSRTFDEDVINTPLTIPKACIIERYNVMLEEIQPFITKIGL